MKKRNLSRIIFLMLILAVGLSTTFAFKNPDQLGAGIAKSKIVLPNLMGPGTGIPKSAIAGSDIYDANGNLYYRCGDVITVFVVNVSDNLTTGTTIYFDSHLNNKFTPCVISSTSSPTIGSSFAVGWGSGVGVGVIGATATPC